MIAQHALRDAIVRLNDHAIANAPRDARVLLAHAMGIDPSRLTLELSQVLGRDVLAQYQTMIDQRCTHKPVSRILGYREFWGRRFMISADVLDPRGDTETLVQAVLPHPVDRLLDLGTGSGILALTLIAEWPNAQAVATDISDAALSMAQQNAIALSLGARVEFIQSDWFERVQGTYDLIVSNPPYITDDEMSQLEPDVVQFDPEIALTPGGDGLHPYRVIAAQAPAFLNPGGRVAVEIGWQQGDAVAGYFRSAGFSGVEILTDLDGKNRVVVANWR